MAAPTYITWNGATSALTAATPSVATGATIKTMLQIKSGTPKMRVIEWGYSFDTAPTVKVNVELVETGTVFATVTQGVIAAYSDVTGPASQAVLSTSGTGYTSSSEGTVTATRLLAYQEELGTSFKQQFPLNREPEINGGSALRIRVTTGTTINMTCYIIWEE